jgi:hypothetical protein
MQPIASPRKFGGRATRPLFFKKSGVIMKNHKMGEKIIPWGQQAPGIQSQMIKWGAEK